MTAHRIGCLLAASLITAACASRGARVTQPAPAAPAPAAPAAPAPTALAPNPPMAARVGGTTMAPGTLDSTALGSPARPVLANGPTGQREYLLRLQCRDLKTPTFVRSGSTGSRAGYGDGHILDGYAVTCPGDGTRIEIYMDMYHAGRTMEPVPGFTILPETPARMAQGCPPAITANADSNAAHIFSFLEVAKPPVAVVPWGSPVRGYGLTGLQQVSFVIDTLGVPVATTFTAGGITAPDRFEAVKKLIGGTRFTPAEHHPGCKVPYRFSTNIVFG